LTGWPLMLACLLAIYLIFVQPYIGYRSFHKFQSEVQKDGRARVRFYVRGIVSKWLMVGVVLAILIEAGLPLSSIGLNAPSNLYHTIIWPLVGALFLLVTTLLFRRLASQPGGLEQLEGAFLAPRQMLPVTNEERSLWAVAALSAGICEEILYRGFLLFFLVAIFPQTNIWGAVVLSSLFFGVAHFYQGMRGIVATGIIGFLLAWLYIASGSLLAPIILHALIDLRVMFLFPREKSQPVA
jgi:membrane protease YdiL (CAAX protease family)